MEFLELAKQRYSCRNFLNRKIDLHTLEKVLEAGRVAPSAANQQPWYFILVEEESQLQLVKSCYARPWITSAPMVIVICGDHRKSWKRDDGKDHCDIDIAITVDHMTLAATEAGLATCWVCKFDAMRCASILGLPEGVEPIVMLPLGYPAGEGDINRHEALRKKLPDIVKKERWTD